MALKNKILTQGSTQIFFNQMNKDFTHFMLFIFDNYHYLRFLKLAT